MSSFDRTAQSQASWIVLAAALGAAAPSLGQRPVTVNVVKQLDTGMRVCKQEAAFEVDVQEGLDGILAIKVVLKPAPDSLGPEVRLKIELVDAGDRPADLADSAGAPVSEEPPWLFVTADGENTYRLELRNRQPGAGVQSTQRYKIRVSVDSVKNSGKETRPFWLYWKKGREPFCSTSRTTGG